MQYPEPPPAPVDDPRETMRRHLDRLNSQFLRMSEGFTAIDDRLREIILDHLDEIGLDDIRPSQDIEP